MIKYMRVFCYQENLKTKYGDSHHLTGLAYQNKYKNSKGNENVDLWVPVDKLKVNDDILQKDLYVEFGPNNSIYKLEIK